jgi:hypothetical protein
VATEAYLSGPISFIEVICFAALILLSGVGTYFSSCCDNDSAIIITIIRLPDGNPN